MSWKNARTVAISFFQPAIRWSRTLRPSSPMPPGGDHGLTRLTGAQPLGNSIDIEVDDPILGQIALDKSLVPPPTAVR